MRFKSDAQRRAVMSKFNNRFALYRDENRPMIVRSTENPQVDMIVPNDFKHFEVMQQLPDEWYSGLKSVTYATDWKGGKYHPVVNLDRSKQKFIDHNRNLIGNGGWDKDKLSEHWDELYKANVENRNADRPYVELFYNVPPGVVKHEVVHHIEHETLGEGGESIPETVQGLKGGWGYSDHFDSKLHHFDDAAYAAAMMHLKNPTFKELESYESGSKDGVDVSGIKQDFGKMLDVNSPNVREKYIKLISERK